MIESIQWKGVSQMRGNTAWNYKPFTRLIDMPMRELPFICRIAPFAGGFEMQWFDNGQPEGGMSAAR